MSSFLLAVFVRVPTAVCSKTARQCRPIDQKRDGTTTTSGALLTRITEELAHRVENASATKTRAPAELTSQSFVDF
jgi:hypothetical protein